MVLNVNMTIYKRKGTFYIIETPYHISFVHWYGELHIWDLEDWHIYMSHYFNYRAVDHVQCLHWHLQMSHLPSSSLRLLSFHFTNCQGQLITN